MELYFKRPAGSFMEALPIGNGRMGAMIYGELMREQIVLNESSMWSGSQEDTDREDAVEYLGEIRRLLADGQAYEAEQVFREHFTCKGAGSNYAHGSVVPYGCYQILGRLHLSYFQAVSPGRISCDCAGQYSRILDLETGEARVTFSAFGVSFTRTYFAPKEEDAILIRFQAGESGAISFSAGLDRDERFSTEAVQDECFLANSFGQILMYGQLDDGYGTDRGVQYACAATVRAVGGKVWTEGNRVYVKDADEAVLILTAETDMAGFMGKIPSKDIKAAVCVSGQRIAKMDYEEILYRHKKQMKQALGNMEFRLAGKKEMEQLPTPERITRFIHGEEDPGLLTLYVAYARYLLEASSREGGLAANLQGIWADEIQTPWNGDWHLNAQQMIYWIAEKANLSDCHMPYLKLTEALVEPGRKTAKAYYGARGWLVHTCTNPWGFTSPLEDAAWGSTTGSPAWQCCHLWEHFLYTKDEEYLKWAYPIMKEAALFYVDMLIEDPRTGWLVTSPSSSPENSYLDQYGRICSLCQGPAYDRELVYFLFSACLEAQYVLRNDPFFSELMKDLMPKLAPVEIAPDGRIMEWEEKYEEPMPYHRHLAHLWGVYPGQMVIPRRDIRLAEAAKKSLDQRGKTTAGWAIAYRMCLNARLGRKEESYGFVRDMFRYATAPNLFNLAYHCDETEENPKMPDLETARYPFQIDGNQGNAAGILLMIEDDFAWIEEEGTMMTEIFLLPALPEQWKEGSVQGLCAKGGFILDFSWKDGKIQFCRVKGKKDAKCRIYIGEKVYSLLINNTTWEMTKEQLEQYD